MREMQLPCQIPRWRSGTPATLGELSEPRLVRPKALIQACAERTLYCREDTEPRVHRNVGSAQWLSIEQRTAPSQIPVMVPFVWISDVQTTLLLALLVRVAYWFAFPFTSASRCETVAFARLGTLPSQRYCGLGALQPHTRRRGRWRWRQQNRRR